MRANQLRQGLAIAVLIIVIGWLAYLIWGLAHKTEVAWREAHDTKAQYAELEERKNTLQANLSALETPRGQDGAMREAFGVAKPGEEVIVVVPPSEATSAPPQSFWRRMWNWF